MVKNIFSFIVNNKRIMYFSCIGVLLIFCLILNYTFSLFTTGSNNISANITVGDLDYRMEINDGDPSAIVGNKDKSNYIIGDRILLSKAELAEQFDISLISLNSFDTKYEITYNFCEDVSCSKYINKPEDVNIYYGTNNSEVNGMINGSSAKVISLIIHNESTIDYYVEIGLNVGYKNNELVLKNQINEMFLSNKLDGNLTVLAYVNGKEVSSFPSTPNYETSVKCTLEDGSLAKARGVFVYSENGWELNVYGVNQDLTTCRVDFTEVLQVTYDILVERLKCANLNTTLADENMVIKYTGNCTLKNDSSLTGSGNWRIIFKNGGTLTFSGLIYLDIFVVGGGATGGYGGVANTYKRMPLDNTKNYTITIGGTGAQSKLDVYTAAGGTTSSGSNGVCEFGETVSGGSCKYTDNGYSGLYAGRGSSGKAGAGNSGTNSEVCDWDYWNGNYYNCRQECNGAATAAAANTGSGGGLATTYCGAGGGGSGIVVIRNAI